jgi:hypothetical protein
VAFPPHDAVRVFDVAGSAREQLVKDQILGSREGDGDAGQLDAVDAQ